MNKLHENIILNENNKNKISHCFGGVIHSKRSSGASRSSRWTSLIGRKLLEALAISANLDDLPTIIWLMHTD